MKDYLKFSIYLFLLISFLIVEQNIIFAQEIISDSVSSVTLSSSPLNPRGGETVIMTVLSDSIDLDSSRIVWYVNGIARKEAGGKSITIKTSDDGQKTLIRVIVETNDGIIKEASREISPLGVDLVIEPISYVNPFYKGKPLFISEGVLKITAIPGVMINGSLVSGKDLNFRWSKDGNILGDNSGKGKDSVVISGSIPVRDIDIGVEILDDKGNVLAQNSKTIIRNDPLILFYENSALYGILYNLAISGNYYIGNREEVKIIAKPMFFSFLNDNPPESVYSWSVNGNVIEQTGKANEIVFRQVNTNLKSIANISIDVRNSKKINQYVNSVFNIEFGE